jgi:hypothetical protein
MEPIPRFALSVRACQTLICLSTILLGLGLQTGCSNRRNAYRPIVFNRARSTSCPSGDCGTVVTSPTVIRSQPGFGESVDAAAPNSGSNPTPTPFGFEGSPNEEPTLLEPVTPPKSSTDPGATRTNGLPPEPALERPEGTSSRQLNRPRIESSPTRAGVVTPAPPAAAPAPTEDADEPVLAPPSRTSLKSSQDRLSPQRRSLIRKNLETFVNDPDDLFTPPRADRPWRYIVLHHSSHDSGSLASIDADHRERLGTMGCGYHFVVGNGSESPDGRIEVAQRWAEQKGGQHCRDSRVNDINEYGIGICLIGNFDDGRPSASQVEATRALIAYLQQRYEIPKGNVVTHDVVAKTAANCPGKNFPTESLLGRAHGMARN